MFNDIPTPTKILLLSIQHILLEHKTRNIITKTIEFILDSSMLIYLFIS